MKRPWKARGLTGKQGIKTAEGGEPTRKVKHPGLPFVRPGAKDRFAWDSPARGRSGAFRECLIHVRNAVSWRFRLIRPDAPGVVSAKAAPPSPHPRARERGQPEAGPGRKSRDGDP